MTIPVSQAKPIHYDVSFPDAKKHYAQISITVNAKPGDIVTFKMPVWTPGSYKVREFSQHVDQSWFTNGENTTKPIRTNKNTWECLAKSAGDLTFTYNLYAFELGVRTSYVDQYMAFLHGPSAFIYVVGKEKENITISFNTPSDWKNVEMPLPFDSKESHFTCNNYDLLADSPVALGTFDVSTYETAGVPHKIVMIGHGNYDLVKVTNDFKRITDEEVKMFDGKHPSPQYIHFIQNVDNGGGGLEHLNCQTSQVNRWNYGNEERYRNFLGLISHEYFHLWNVKRIRPVELGPFDYETENYTDLLWVAEGITSYFDDLFLKRIGIHTTETYLAALAGNINRLENQPGKDVMTLEESSKLAWVKAYLGNENSKNVTISYYNKGMLVAWMLDLEIMQNTKGKKRLDDVMLALYNDYYVDKDRGFTPTEFIAVCERIADKSLTDFFTRYVYDTPEIPYSEYLNYTGVVMDNKAQKNPSIGMSTKHENGKLIITYVHPSGSGSKAGLSVNDEIIAIDGWRAGADIDAEAGRYEIGQEVELIYARNGKMYSAKVTIEANPAVEFHLSPLDDMTPEQKKVYESWLN